MHDALDGLRLVASGRAIGTVPAWTADGLHHPGVMTFPLRDAPTVATRLVWRADDLHPLVAALVDLARAWTALRRHRDEPGAIPPQ